MDPSRTGDLREADIRRNIDYLRSVAYTMSQGHDFRKEMKSVLQLFAPGRHRVLRLLCYPILKEYADLDYSEIYDAITSDITSNDPELQLNAIKFLYNFPIDKQIELFRTHEKDFLKILIVPEFHYEKLVCLNDFLLKCLIKSALSEENENDKIYDFYSKLSELVFHASRDFSSTALFILKNLYLQYAQLNYDIYRQDQYFDGNGSTEQILRPLIVQLTNTLFPNYNTILNIIYSYEIRTRAGLLTFAVTLLEVAMDLFSKNYYVEGADLLVEVGKKNLHFVMQDRTTLPLKNIVQNLIDGTLLEDLNFQAYELDVWIPTYINTFKILNIAHQPQWKWVIKDEDKSEIVRKMFMIFSGNLKKVPYKRDLNILLLNFANFTQFQNNASRLVQSMKLLEFAELYVQNSINRLFIYLVSLINMVKVSLELVEEGKKSVIFGLFQQSWFLHRIQDKEDENSVRFKEEFLICLIESCIFIQYDFFMKEKNFSSYPTILMEVLDLATRIIDWKMEYKPYNEYQKSSYLLTLDLYFVLVENISSLADSMDARNHINELIKRVNSQELAFDIKLKVLNSLAKKSSEDILAKMSLNDIITEFRRILINEKVPIVFEETYIQKLSGSVVIKNYITQIELMLDILYNWSLKTDNTNRNAIVNLLSDYTDYLGKVRTIPTIFQPFIASIVEYLELIMKFLINEEEVNVSEIKISTNFLNQIDFAKDEDYDESESLRTFNNLSYAFNIFYMRSYEKSEVFESDTLENGNPLENLSYLWFKNSDKKELNHRSVEPQLISGIGDIVQIYAQHAINAPHSLISVNLRIINLNRFIIERVKVIALYPNNLDPYPEVTNPKFVSIESIGPGEAKNVAFSFYVRRAVNVNMSFEIVLAGVGENDEPVRFKTLPYSISFLEFLVPNYMMCPHQMIFENIWQNIPYNVSLRSKLLTNEKELLSALRLTKFYVSTFNNKETWKKAYMLAYTWDNHMVGIILTNESFEIETDHMMVTIEVRSSNMEIIEKIKEEDSEFISLLSNENLEFLF